MVKEKRMKFFVLATFFVVGAWTGAAYGEVTVPDNVIVQYGGKGCNADGTPWPSRYSKGANTVYVYDCKQYNRAETIGVKVIERSTRNLEFAVERSVQHGVNRQIDKFERKLNKIFGR
jgi:hypothetical protein